MCFRLLSVRSRKTDLVGLVANIVGITVVAASRTVGVSEDVTMSGVALATLGMALMYLVRLRDLFNNLVAKLKNYSGL